MLLGVIKSSLFVILFVINNFGGLIGSAWLGYALSWRFFAIWVAACFALPILVGLVHGIIGFCIMIIANILGSDRNKYVAIFFGSINVLLVLAVMLVWGGFLFSSAQIIDSSTRGMTLPLSLLVFSLGAGPWQYLASKEQDNPGSQISSMALTAGHIAALFYSVLFGMNAMTSAIILFGFLSIGLIAQAFMAYSISRQSAYF